MIMVRDWWKYLLLVALAGFTVSALRARLPQDRSGASQQHPVTATPKQLASAVATYRSEDSRSEPAAASVRPITSAKPARTFPTAQQLASWSDSRISRVFAQHPGRLGCLSMGKPNHGRLLNPVRLGESSLWRVMNPKRSWGTPELVGCLRRVVGAVNEQLPGGPRLVVGDLSAEGGGHIHPHASHQSGRDVDLGFYYRWGEAWYVRATRKNLDMPRTWLLIKGLLTTCDVEYMFLDLSVQQWLKQYALKSGEDSAWLDTVFRRRRGLPGIVRHRWGHRTHVHVRLRAEESVAKGRRVGDLIRRLDRNKPGKK